MAVIRVFQQTARKVVVKRPNKIRQRVLGFFCASEQLVQDMREMLKHRALLHFALHGSCTHQRLRSFVRYHLCGEFVLMHQRIHHPVPLLEQVFG